VGKLISYVRVSTQRQGASGLGLDAQRMAVLSYAQSGGHDIIYEVQEIESARKCDRAQLTHALALTRHLSFADACEKMSARTSGRENGSMTRKRGRGT
jgi:DNA invertase Pin-like site-specific DNA recombinase